MDDLDVVQPTYLAMFMSLDDVCQVGWSHTIVCSFCRSFVVVWARKLVEPVSRPSEHVALHVRTIQDLELQ